MARVLGDRMGRDIFFYSISIDPEVDTPAVLKAYKEKYQMGRGWTFLTGRKQDIDLVSKKLGLYSEPDPSDPDGHLPYLLIGSATPAATTGTTPGAAPAAGVNMTLIVDPYLRIQRALNVDTVAGVQSDARLIAGHAATLGTKGAAMQTAAADLQQAADLTAARTAFARLSDAVIQYARESGAALGDEVKVAYCPMVQKYWLQKGDTIQNPFYGKLMSDCGRITTSVPRSK